MNEKKRAEVKKVIDELIDSILKVGKEKTREEKDEEAARMQEILGRAETVEQLHDSWTEVMMENKPVDPPSDKAYFVLRGIGMRVMITRKGLRTHFIEKQKMAEKLLDKCMSELEFKRLIRVLEDSKGYSFYVITKLGIKALGQHYTPKDKSA
jgi:hypothetical protein